MGAFASRVPLDPVIDGFDWVSQYPIPPFPPTLCTRPSNLSEHPPRSQASLGQATVVDVGGGHGPVSIGLAKRFPGLSFVVEDLPDVVGSRPAIPDPDAASRIRFVEHDFLAEQQPIGGADVYFFRAVFHNWPEAYCVRILRNQIPALRKGASLVIAQALLPRPRALMPHAERRVR